MQLKHSEHKFKKTIFPIVVVCDKIRTPENIGMILRIAESFGVQKVIFDKESPSPGSRSVKRISRDANKLVAFEMNDNIADYLAGLKEEKYRLIALEITANSKPIGDLKLKKQKIVLILGAERNGISKKLLDLCDDECHIEMYGTNSSMNVVNALGIALYEITGKMLN